MSFTARRPFLHGLHARMRIISSLVTRLDYKPGFANYSRWNEAKSGQPGRRYSVTSGYAVCPSLILGISRVHGKVPWSSNNFLLHNHRTINSSIVMQVSNESILSPEAYNASGIKQVHSFFEAFHHCKSGWQHRTRYAVTTRSQGMTSIIPIFRGQVRRAFISRCNWQK